MTREIICVLVSAAGTVAVACTGFYVGRKVSADGTTIIARTVDSKPATCKRFEILPHVENVPGRHYLGNNTTTEWPLPATTYKAVVVPSVPWGLKAGRYEGACANEKGVMLSGTVTAYSNVAATNADPFVSSGFAEASLPGLLISCSATAREAVELLGRVVGSRGHNGAEIYMIADRDEAWYVEVYTGHEWAAVRMPEDKVACWGNQFMIRSFDPSSPDTLCSPGLVSLPEKAGFLVKGADGLPDLYRTYAPELTDYSNYRTWFGHRTFAPETAGDYATDRPMELFYAPSHKVGYREMFELMRTRYEGTDHNPEENGLPGVRTIGTTKQATSHVLSIDASLPERFRCTLWASLGNCEHTVFLPMNAAITACDEAYATDQTEGEFRYDARIASMAFRRLAALAEKDRRWYGRGVRDFWHAREDTYLAEYPGLLKTLDAAKLTEWTLAAQRKDLADARRIFDDLAWYITANNRIEGDGSGATNEPPAPFKP